MSRKKFLKPFTASVATLVAGTQAQAIVETRSPNSVSATAEAAQSSDLGLTLSKVGSKVQLAQHDSHSSHSSHDSHSSHSSSSF